MCMEEKKTNETAMLSKGRGRSLDKKEAGGDCQRITNQHPVDPVRTAKSRHLSSAHPDWR